MTEEVRAYAARVSPAVRALYFWRVLLEVTALAPPRIGALWCPVDDARRFIDRELHRDPPVCREWLLAEWLRWLRLPGEDLIEKTIAYLEAPEAP